MAAAVTAVLVSMHVSVLLVLMHKHGPHLEAKNAAVAILHHLRASHEQTSDMHAAWNLISALTAAVRISVHYASLYKTSENSN